MNRLLGTARNGWRQLTSMRTALVLLFLLAVAAIPGSVLPQKRLSPEKVAEYARANPTSAPWLDRFQFFDVYSSVWFSAIYLLLFVSLVGCLVPRFRGHLIALTRVPPNAPKRLERLPEHADGLERDGDLDRNGRFVAERGDLAATAERLRALMRKRRFRAVVRESDDGYTVSAEKGYLKETGNLLFHFALLALLIGMALGGLYGWHGNRILVQGQGFCNSLQQYDEFSPGSRVDGERLPRFCLRLEDFKASYLDSGQAKQFNAKAAYDVDGKAGERAFSVNNPLRLGPATAYLLAHGYAPEVRYTDRTGRSQTVVVPFLTIDNALTSQGVVAFPDVNIGVVDNTYGPTGKVQVAFDGTYLPTVPDSVHAGASAFPDERDPRLMLRVYMGDLGMDAGLPQSVYKINQEQIGNGLLRSVGDPIALKKGESATLPDGSKVEFLGTRPWIAVSVRHDPGEELVLGGAVLLVVGLLGSLAGRRRRIFFRVTPGGVEAGGLPRTDYAGFTAEFEAIVQEAREGAGPDGELVRPVAGGHDSGVPGGDAVLRG
jgi:cytochrome c biogenesis protein